MERLVVTIDGPAASGKSTTARLLAGKLGAAFLDTGAMYRALTLAAMRAGVELTNENRLVELLSKCKFQFCLEDDRTVVRINGEDVTEQIRAPAVTANARYIASAPRVRERLVEMQRQFAAKYGKIVTEGRDQGTVAFPDADVKFYLTADITERARRRQAEIGGNAEENLERIKKALEKRDSSDQNRQIGPLKPAPDAIVVDTTNLSIEEVVNRLLRLVEAKCS